MSKQSITPSSKSTNPISKPIMDLAKYGDNVRSLLWFKIVAAATPEMRQMLFAYAQLCGTVSNVIPAEKPLPVRHENLLEKIKTAEHLLTGVTQEMFQ